MIKFVFFLILSFQSIRAEAYERFVGLGSSCVTRTQINHHLSQRFQRPANSFGGGQLFDWVIIHDYNLFSQAIENDLADLFERSDLIVGANVRNKKYKMTWSHLFSKNEKEVCPENILELEYETKKQKIEYLIGKFKGLRDYRTLYIIAYPYDETQSNTVEPDPFVLVRVSKALEKLRGNQNFSLLYCPLKQRFNDFNNIFVRQVDNPIDAVPIWVGDYNKWDKILKEFPFAIEKSEPDSSHMDNSKFVQ